jgi:hypothetical protein
MKFGEDAGKEARDLAREALEAAGDDQKHKYLDTLGAIEIACGRTEEEDIRSGLRRCQAALEAVDTQSPERPVAEAFFSLHERRAFRRLLGWS